MARLFSCCAVADPLLCCFTVVLTHCFAGTLFCGCQYGCQHGVSMPGGRSEVFWERWMRNGTPLQRAGLVEEQAAPRSVALRGENIVSVAAGQGRPRRSGIRCRDGAGADGIRVRTASSPRGLGPEGILDSDTLARGVCISGPQRRARKIGVQTAPAARFVPARCSAVSLRPEPVPSARGLAHRMRPRGNPCPQTRSLDRSSATGKCSKIPSKKIRSEGLLGVKSTPTTATPTPTTAISCRRRLNRPRRPYLRLQNPKNEGLWSM